jgi:hypothetical protein
MTPTGLYERTQEEIDYLVETFGYCREEYGIYKGKYKVNRCEFDDGAVMIEGGLTDFNGEAELRVRYISPYNFIIAAQNSPVNNVKFDRILKDLCDKIIVSVHGVIAVWIKSRKDQAGGFGNRI